MKRLVYTLAALSAGLGASLSAMSGPILPGSFFNNSVYVYTNQVIPVDQQSGYLILNPTGQRAPAPGISVPFTSTKVPTNSAWQFQSSNTLVAPATGTYLIEYHTNSALPNNASPTFIGTAMWTWLNINGTPLQSSKSTNAIGSLGGLYPLTRSVLVPLNKGDRLTLQVAQSGIDGANPVLGGFGDWIANSVSASLTITQIG